MILRTFYDVNSGLNVDLTKESMRSPSNIGFGQVFLVNPNYKLSKIIENINASGSSWFTKNLLMNFKLSLKTGNYQLDTNKSK